MECRNMKLDMAKTLKHTIKSYGLICQLIPGNCIVLARKNVR